MQKFANGFHRKGGQASIAEAIRQAHVVGGGRVLIAVDSASTGANDATVIALFDERRDVRQITRTVIKMRARDRNHHRVSLRDLKEERRWRAEAKAASAPIIERDARRRAPVPLPDQSRRFPPPRSGLPSKFGTYQGAF